MRGRIVICTYLLDAYADRFSQAPKTRSEVRDAIRVSMFCASGKREGGTGNNAHVASLVRSIVSAFVILKRSYKVWRASPNVSPP